MNTWDKNESKEYTITSIEAETFNTECQPDWTEKDLPMPLWVGLIDKYRQDAAAGGILAHSPYCPECYPYCPD